MVGDGVNGEACGWSGVVSKGDGVWLVTTTGWFGDGFSLVSNVPGLESFTAALPPPPLPPLPPSLSIPSPVDRRDDIPESEQPPRLKGRDDGIRDVGYGIRDTWVDPAEVVPEIAPMTVGEVNTRVVELEELPIERDTRTCIDSTRGCSGWPTRHATAAEYSHSDTAPGTRLVETSRVIRDMRREMSDMQAELLALREQRRTAGQSGPEARIPDHQEASGDADSHI
ncbi:hypothetical protein Tco_0730058 [Tanacetum coccineum]|uniref:Uncharacterized protein n=1 Tax=Tanacetum coccineum TaxID=301880 RepID=A0ABQ4YRI6_9ASTR